MRTQLLVFIASVFCVVLVVGGHNKKRKRDEEIRMTVEDARLRIRQDLDKLWNKTSEAVTTSHYDMLRLYSDSTMEQAKEAIHSIAHFANLTKTHTQHTKQRMPKEKTTLSVLSCMEQAEINTLRSYKSIGFSLHNCIRNAQTQTEHQYQERVKVLESNKWHIRVAFDLYSRTLENCVDESCVMKTVLGSVVNYEQLGEYIRGNVTEIHNLSTRYILRDIAVGCVGETVLSLEKYYETGRNLVHTCLHNATQPPTAQ